MPMTEVSPDLLGTLEPISALPAKARAELAALCRLEKVARSADPFQGYGVSRQLVYLIKGQLALRHPNGSSAVIVGGSGEASRPLGEGGAAIAAATAITDIELLHVDRELLDKMVACYELAEGGGGRPVSSSDGGTPSTHAMSAIFNAASLRQGPFAQLPSTHIDELLRRFKRIEVQKGEVIVQEGSVGDYYYVIESGRCKVERMVGGVSMVLADLKSGDVFGEDALVSEAKRNATVSMRSAGVLLCLDKRDFIELLRAPLLHRLSAQEARRRVAEGAQWIDVRYPSEYQYDGLQGAINIPLSEIRNAFDALSRDREYILYCQSERRSAAAAFLLAQRGYRASFVTGGLWGAGSAA